MFELIRANKRRSVLLVIGFMVIVVVVGTIIGLIFGNGPLFAVIALRVRRRRRVRARTGTPTRSHCG